MAKEIPLTQGKVALVDDADYNAASLHKWSFNNGYAVAKIRGERVALHRFIVNAEKGDEVDHKNTNKLDCQRQNLRFCSRSQNGANRNPNSNNISGFKGVSPTNSRRTPFKAEIRVSGQKIYLGSFESAKAAALAYDQAAVLYFGDYARTNF